MPYGNGGEAGMDKGGYATLRDQPSRMPLIGLEMDRQEKALAHLHDVIGNLENRLSPIVRPSGPEAANVNKTVPPPIAVPLSSNLSDQNSKLEAASARLVSILDRIEL